MKSGITTEEWLAELERLSHKDSAGFTSHEWAERLGMSLRVTMERLRVANARGFVQVGKRVAKRIDGKPCYVPVYLVRKPKK